MNILALVCFGARLAIESFLDRRRPLLLEAMSNLEITDSQMKEALATVKLQGAALKSAKRSLSTLKEKDASIDVEDPYNQKIVLALKSLGVGKAKLASFQDWVSKTQLEEGTEEDILVVTKASYPQLDEDDLIKEYIIPAEDVLGSIDKRLYWFVSEAVNYEPGARKRLGLRARHWKTALRHIADMTPAAASIEAPAIEDVASEEKPKEIVAASVRDAGVLEGGTETLPVYIVHVHDEAAMRLKSHVYAGQA